MMPANDNSGKAWDIGNTGLHQNKEGPLVTKEIYTKGALPVGIKSRSNQYRTCRKKESP